MERRTDMDGYPLCDERHPDGRTLCCLVEHSGPGHLDEEGRLWRTGDAPGGLSWRGLISGPSRLLDELRSLRWYRPITWRAKWLAAHGLLRLSVRLAQGLDQEGEQVPAHDAPRPTAPDEPQDTPDEPQEQEPCECGECHDSLDAEPPMPGNCCELRRKILVGIQAVLPEEACGVSDAALADVYRPDMRLPNGQPVLAFRFCPWCGKPRPFTGEYRITWNDNAGLEG